MAEHTVKAFDSDIGKLRGLIAEMGGLAEEAIHKAVDALVRHDLESAKIVVAGDARIDALEAEVDQLAVRIIALRAPMADDLREVIVRHFHPQIVEFMRQNSGTKFDSCVDQYGQGEPF